MSNISAVTTVFGVLWNCASSTFSGVKHIQYHSMSSWWLHWGYSNNALCALRVPLEPSLATRVLTMFIMQRCFQETVWKLYNARMINLQVKTYKTYNLKGWFGVNSPLGPLHDNVQPNTPSEAFFPWSDIGEVSLQPTGLVLALTEPVLYLVNYPTNNAWNVTTLLYK